MSALESIRVNVVRLRKERGLTADALAQMTDGVISRNVLVNFETGRTDSLAQIDSVIALAAALGVPISLLAPEITEVSPGLAEFASLRLQLARIHDLTQAHP